MKKNFRKIIGIILCLTLTLCLITGCGGENTKAPDPIPVPEGGWTKSQILSVTTVFGNRVSCPPIYGDFKRNVDLEMATAAVSDGKGMVGISFNNQYMGFLIYDNVNSEADITDAKPIYEIYMKEQVGYGSKQLSVNGVKFGDTKAKMIEALGEPHWITRRETLGVYEFTDGGELTVDLLGDKVYGMSLSGLTAKK